MKNSIDKMAEWLEIELKKAEQYCDVNIGAFIPHPFQTVLDKARQLQAEEPQPYYVSDEVLKAYLEKGITHLYGRELCPYEKPTAEDDAQKRYYNECAKNSVLYDLCDDLITELEKYDANNPILERAETDLVKYGFSFGKPTADKGLVEEAYDIIKHFMDGEDCDHSVGICYCGIKSWLDRASRYKPTESLAEKGGFWVEDNSYCAGCIRKRH